jgi:hypothetical protein
MKRHPGTKTSAALGVAAAISAEGDAEGETRIAGDMYCAGRLGMREVTLIATQLGSLSIWRI